MFATLGGGDEEKGKAALKTNEAMIVVSDVSDDDEEEEAKLKNGELRAYKLCALSNCVSWLLTEARLFPTQFPLRSRSKSQTIYRLSLHSSKSSRSSIIRKTRLVS